MAAAPARAVPGLPAPSSRALPPPAPAGPPAPKHPSHPKGRSLTFPACAHGQQNSRALWKDEAAVNRASPRFVPAALPPHPPRHGGTAPRRPTARFPAAAQLQSSWPWWRCYIAETGFMSGFLFLLLLPSHMAIGTQDPPDRSGLWGHLVQYLVINTQCTLQKR